MIRIRISIWSQIHLWVHTKLATMNAVNLISIKLVVVDADDLCCGYGCCCCYFPHALLTSLDSQTGTGTAISSADTTKGKARRFNGSSLVAYLVVDDPQQQQLRPSALATAIATAISPATTSPAATTLSTTTLLSATVLSMAAAGNCNCHSAATHRYDSLHAIVMKEL